MCLCTSACHSSVGRSRRVLSEAAESSDTTWAFFFFSFKEARLAFGLRRVAGARGRDNQVEEVLLTTVGAQSREQF